VFDGLYSSRDSANMAISTEESMTALLRKRVYLSPGLLDCRLQSKKNHSSRMPIGSGIFIYVRVWLFRFFLL